MGQCPNCNKPVEKGLAKCSACGHELPSSPTDTLDVEKYFGQSDTPEAGSTSDNAADSPAAAEESASEDAKGTLGAPDFDADSAPAPSGAFDQSAGSDPKSAADREGTLPFPESGASDSASGTLKYGVKELSDAEQGRSGSGTAGRLKRIWQNAAGSSVNPMQTLKSDDALATDSVFAKVAPRILVTDTAIEIAEKISDTGSQPDRRQQIENCISMATEDGAIQQADYNLTGFLGQGAMGVVLRAHQKAIGRDVAIKMIQPAAGDSKSNTNAQKKKFFYEAQITGKLDHPNIVPVYELGVSNSVLFYSMKLIVGTEWKDAIGDRSRNQNLDILMKVADAMAFAHQKNIIHRDLKPENIMLGAFGEVLVTDWGCAVDLNRSEKFSGAGSPPWMAPEMACHDMKQIGTRSDIYLLGAMLYQIVAGHPPHPGRTALECLQAAYKNVILEVEAKDPLLDIALQAMETDPNDRYSTVEAMQEAIREYRRHAESIALSERSEATLVQAIESKDYERFSRTMFGFQDALELWSGNTAAVSGLANARLNYGQAAFDKGDFDLCLQTLDRKVPAEAKLYDDAAKAKKAAEEREGRFRTLRRAFAAVVLFAIVGLSGLSGYAFWQRSVAVDNLELAQQNEKQANENLTLAQQNEQEAKDNLAEANRQKGIAETNLAEANRQKEEADRQKGIAETNLAEANRQKVEADRQKGIAETNLEEANRQKGIAEENLVEANTQKSIAQARTAQVELGSYQSKVALALSQVNQSDVANATASLNAIADSGSYVALKSQGNVPNFDNWALNRVQLLSNADLLSDKTLGDVSAVTFAANANVGVVATMSGPPNARTGILQVVQLHGKRLQALGPQENVGAVVDGISISPAGDEVIYSLLDGVNGSTIHTWRLDGASQPERVAGRSDGGLRSNASIQGFAMSEDRVVGGINGGLWVWSRRQGNWQDSDPVHIANVRGRLRTMQLLDDSQVLVLAELNDSLNIHLVSLPVAEGQPVDRESSRLISINASPESEFGQERLSAAAYYGGNLILGVESGKLFSVNLADGAQETDTNFRQLTPQQHQSPIHSIQVHPDGTLLTAAVEPAVQVWKRSGEQLAGWRYDSKLAGTPGNIGGMAFMNGSGLVLGLDQKGNALVWDVERQKQRRQLRRLHADGTNMQYSSPVIEVVTSDDNRRAISIHDDGLVDSWDLVTGKTIQETTVPLVHIGHSPGAAFVDMAIDHDAGLLITSALLPDEPGAGDAVAGSIESPSTNQPQEKVWEFCRWDTRSGKMLDRWTRTSATEQEISLVDSGNLILYASSGDQTLVTEAKQNGTVRFSSKSLGSYFGEEHPVDPKLMMMVKRSGATRMFDARLPDGGWSSPGNRIDYELAENSGLLSDDDIPLAGRWAPAGDRFYMFWSSGRITELVWENATLSKGRDLRGQALVELGIDLANENVSTGREGAARSAPVRLQSRRQVDLKVRTQDAYDLLYMAIRFPGNEGRTRLVRLAMPKAGGKPQADKAEKLVGATRLVLTDEDVPQLIAEVESQIEVPTREVVLTRARAGNTYFATAEGTVYRVSQTGETAVFGNPKILSASGNAAASRVVTLRAGGVLWRADLDADGWDWTPLEPAPRGANQVAMSPDGKHLLIDVTVDGQKTLMIADADSGSVRRTIDQGQCGAWSAAGDLAWILDDGTVHTEVAGAERTLGKLSQQGDVCSTHFFTESWNDGDLPTQQWLAVHVEPESVDEDGAIEYFRLEPQAADADTTPKRTTLARGISVLSCSPTEGIFVTGGSGTVSVHFAVPTLGQFGEDPLFNLEGHAGATQINCLRFTQDGKTLISTDSGNRLFGWLSEDIMDGISDERELPAGVSSVQ